MRPIEDTFEWKMQVYNEISNLALALIMIGVTDAYTPWEQYNTGFFFMMVFG